MDRVNNFFWVREKPSQELEWIRAEKADSTDWSRPVVVVSGAFDLLHCGHMRLLFAAREKAPKGTVLCAMDSDRLVKEGHGPGRPIMNWVERAAAISYMPINYLVEVDSTKELTELVERIRPDLYMEGNIHNEFPSRFPWLRKAYIRSAGVHTGELIQRCVESYERSRYR